MHELSGTNRQEVDTVRRIIYPSVFNALLDQGYTHRTVALALAEVALSVMLSHEGAEETQQFIDTLHTALKRYEQDNNQARSYKI